MIGYRHGLSTRMLGLARWYSTGMKQSRTPTRAEALAKWDERYGHLFPRHGSTSHGRSRRDGTRP